MSSRLKNLKKFKEILDTIIETLEDDDTQNSDIIDYVCKSVDSFYSEIKQIITKKKQDKNKDKQRKGPALRRDGEGIRGILHTTMRVKAHSIRC